MSDEYTPTAIANEALDAAGIDYTLGDIEDGTRQSQVILRTYTTCLRQLLRSANWDWARREAPLQLVADATRQTPNVGVLVPSGWSFSYSYPTNCARIRFIPANYLNQDVGYPSDNITPPDPTAPLMTGIAVMVGQPLVPSRFLITSDVNYIPEGASNDLPGVSPTGQTLVLSNVRHAHAVYTYEAFYANTWDNLFRQAMVAFLASRIALPLGKDKKLARALRADNIEIAKAAVQQAMISNGQESWSDSGLAVDWMRVRNSGGFYGSTWGMGLDRGAGYLFGGLDAISWGGGATGNSSAF